MILSDGLLTVESLIVTCPLPGAYCAVGPESPWFVTSIRLLFADLRAIFGLGWFSVGSKKSRYVELCLVFSSNKKNPQRNDLPARFPCAFLQP